jgi:hypothetical protein
VIRFDHILESGFFEVEKTADGLVLDAERKDPKSAAALENERVGFENPLD